MDSASRDCARYWQTGLADPGGRGGRCETAPAAVGPSVGRVSSAPGKQTTPSITGIGRAGSLTQDPRAAPPPRSSLLMEVNRAQRRGEGAGLATDGLNRLHGHNKQSDAS